MTNSRWVVWGLSLSSIAIGAISLSEPASAQMTDSVSEVSDQRTAWRGSTPLGLERQDTESVLPRLCRDMGYHGGPVLDHVKIQNVFWGGSYWNDSSSSGGAQLRADIDAAWTYVGNNAGYYTTLAEYGTANQAMGNGSVLASRTNNLDPPSVVSEQEIQDMLGIVMLFGLVPVPDPNMLYVVYLPQGTTSKTDRDNGWAAHHWTYRTGDDTPVYYASISPTGSLDEATLYASHEVDEAVANPDISNAPAWDEVGDPCEGRSPRGYRFGPYLLEQVYSRVACTCATPAPVSHITIKRSDTVQQNCPMCSMRAGG
jgi:hypothetical protein